MSSLLCAEPLFRAAGAALTTFPRVPGVWKKAFEEDTVVSLGVCGVSGSGVLMLTVCRGPEGERGVLAADPYSLLCSGVDGDGTGDLLRSDAAATL